MKDSDLREMAKNRVEFKEHLSIFIVINAFLIAINLWFSPMVLWSLGVLFFWGIGLAFHFREAYLGSRVVNIEREYQRLKKTHRGR